MPGSGPKFGEMTWWRKGGGTGGCAVYVLAGLVVALALTLGGVHVATADAAPATPETVDQAWGERTNDVCRFVEVGTFGADPNGISMTYRVTNWWGAPHADCCYWSGSNKAEFIYNFNTNRGAWVDPMSWCLRL